MKKMWFVLLLVSGTSLSHAQTDERGWMDKPLFETLTRIQKKTDRFNLYLNMQAGFDAKFQDGFEQGAFRMPQLRIEAKGTINSWLSYRYRQRLNRSNDGNGMIDNMPTSIDYAAIGVQVTPKFSFFMGKQCAAYGGFEFDLNPIDIYEYSDMIDNMSNFMTGVNFGYHFTPNQQVNLQVLDSRNYSFNRTYGIIPDIGDPLSKLQSSKLPLVYTLNWNGNFNDLFRTRWSTSVMSQTKDKNMYYLAMGNELNLGRFNGFFDVMYAKEEVDRNGTITSMVGNAGGHNALNAEYLSLVLKLNYRILPKWNIFVKGMYETASVSHNYAAVKKGKYRTSLGYLGGVEFYPMKENLHFFLTYIGRSYDYTASARQRGFVDYTTNRLTVGFIYQLPLF